MTYGPTYGPAYVRCVNCGCSRPLESLTWNKRRGGYECSDVEWCARARPLPPPVATPAKPK